MGKKDGGNRKKEVAETGSEKAVFRGKIQTLRSYVQITPQEHCKTRACTLGPINLKTALE